ncbi:MAG: 3-deoxy-manno-octulosonate cytidylyltransferase [Bacteroidales bacterium]|jgi:3-deoxy-manno-octulosonate cytidylyltransferase (CMP-KDO synthetase)|nr:3-deoxy-manno-octulosonate cytidylyltransferase [Bacteroidales bacterium]
MKKINISRFTCVIPARYASSRFPGKPLALIGGKTMIRRVWEQASTACSNVYVATDDIRIADEVQSFGGRYIMTSPHHRSGTDRCEEAVTYIEETSGGKVDVVINIQGDEPFVRREQIKMLADCFADPAVEIATLVRKVRPGEDISDPNQPKAVIDLSGNAIYFSRSVIPYLRGVEPAQWAEVHTYYKHLGMYAFRRSVLRKITLLLQTGLEKAEALEQNRWIENGFRIRTAITPWESIGIDTPEDLERASALINEKN